MDERRERRWNFWHWLGMAFAAYVLSFVVLVVDVKLLNAKLVESLVLKEHVLLAIYYPILVLLDYLGIGDGI